MINFLLAMNLRNIFRGTKKYKFNKEDIKDSFAEEEAVKRLKVVSWHPNLNDNAVSSSKFQPETLKGKKVVDKSINPPSETLDRDKAFYNPATPKL